MSALENIIGYEDLKTELRRISDILCNPEKYAKLGVTMPNGLLLVGEPGVGKTTMAMCFIEAVGRKAFICRKKKPNGEFVNEIADVFEKAKKSAPSIVFLDDMDKYANEDIEHKNAEEFVTLQSCIDDAKDSDVFVMGTANDLKNLPKSLLRSGRFDKCINVENPRGKDAENIVEFYLSQKNFVTDIDAAEIAGILEGRSCADLERVINEAGIYAGFENKEKIDMDDVLRACLRIIYDAPEKSLDDDDEIDMIAYHEAGHAVISEILAPGTVNLVTVKKNHGDIGGFSSTNPPKGYRYSKKYMENRVISILGGKAATEIIFGIVDVGAKNDIQKAFNIVEKFVDDYCTYGFDRWIKYPYHSSDALLSRKELMMSSEVEHFYEQAKRILAENRDCLVAVANALMDRKILTGSVLRAIMSEKLIKA